MNRRPSTAHGCAATTDNAAGTFVDVLERVQEMPEEMRVALRHDFGGEARALAPLATQLDLVRGSLNLVGDESSYAGSAMREFENRTGTFGAKLQMFRSRLGEIGAEVGESLLPPLEELLDLIGPIASDMARWIDEHPGATRKILMLAGGALLLRTTFYGFKLLRLVGHRHPDDGGQRHRGGRRRLQGCGYSRGDGRRP